ncbi:MAG TPA: hypothetical protein VNM90_29035 [Haliangium sp.]|nr:hypothetical protein [Haliangium sp.]
MSDHTIPMRVYAELLLKWDDALREALPHLAAEAGGTAAWPGNLEHVQPVTSPPEHGSIVASYGYALILPARQESAPLPVMTTDVLDEMVVTFETGVAGLQERHTVPRWMSLSSARAIARLLRETSQRGILVTLPDSGDAELARGALDVLRGFVTAEEEAQGECELQILGTIVSANVDRSYMLIDAAGRGRVKVTFPRSERRAVCAAMANGNAVEIVVQARLMSDGRLRHARTRRFRDLGSRPDYRAAFEQLWGTARDVFGGVPRDEHGVPDPDGSD